MTNEYRISVLPGDGIGPEVMFEAKKILKLISKKFNLNIKIKEYEVGGKSIEKYGTPLTKKTIIGCEKSDAILFGSVGGPKWDSLPIDKRPERGSLLKLRKKFNLFANLRPSILYPELVDFCPLKRNIYNLGFDILCVRELTGGIYFGKPRGTKFNEKKEEYAFDTEIYFASEIQRIANLAFKLSTKRKKKLTLIDKANVLESSILWRKIVKKTSKNYPEVKLSYLYIDNAVMKIIKEPNKFDVILTSNLFGDIISDECAAISGSIGMLPSASLNEKKFGLYEPSGGSAPDIAGKNISNPISQILSLSMLFRYSLNLTYISDLINKSIKNALKQGYRTKDISDGSNYVSTQEMGDKILFEINNN
ncbi:3-isopropylmalate dehydrogenase (plasmid) [Buchnera aphidicola (Neophyllaphis varicolor)]|uniref:3-isopropylmalate dehydrogenase n=1 Tax=Buchnera aphidicola TaxID=9 RepID=UPI0031B856AE